MDFKIALRNVKKSFKDYGVYFLTLTLAVCIFYTFNSVGSQKALIEIQNSGRSYVDTLNSIMFYTSISVIFILGSLILYANKFLIKKRNKEFGIYMTLGMKKFKISKILIWETLMVGIISLIGGLIIGIIFSQGISVLSLNLFDIDINKYKFVISNSAIIKTIIYFGIMFFFVMIFNITVISKFKIIDLITSIKKNEKMKFKNPFIHLIFFIIGLVFLNIAYAIVLKIGLYDIFDMGFLPLIVIMLGVIGTILFFLSVSSFFIYLFKKIKGVYFKGLNIFVIKQIGSKINTNFLSMSIICLMLFITTVALSSGIAFRNTFNNVLVEATPFDGSAYMYSPENGLTIEKSFEKIGFKFNEGDEVVYFNEYKLGTKLFHILGGSSGYDVIYIKISDYNKIRELKGEEKIELLDDEILMISSVDNLVPIVEDYMKNNDTVKVNGIDYKIKNDKLIKENLITYNFKNNFLTIVISDKVLEDNGVVRSSNVNVNFNKNNKQESEDKFLKVLSEYRYGKVNYDEVGFVSGSTRNSIYEENKGLTTTTLFIGIYLGIIFLISSMALLALQQLTEVNDSIHRYKSLKKLGVSVKQINGTIFTQVLVYFSLPVCLSIIHSVVGLKVVSNFLQTFNSPNIFIPSIITMIVMLIVYLLYFYATYTTYKNVVKNEI